MAPGKCTVADVELLKFQGLGEPTGEKFEDLPVTVPDQVFDDLMGIMLRFHAVAVKGRPARITHFRTRCRRGPSGFQCVLSGRYIEPLATGVAGTQDQQQEGGS
jgi:hypothetical protein